MSLKDSQGNKPENIGELRPVLDANLDISLYTVIWRTLQQQYAQLAQTQRTLNQAVRGENTAWLQFADEYVNLQLIQATLTDANDLLARKIGAIVHRMGATLDSQAIEVIIPASEPYTDELTEILENESYIYLEDCTEPTIHEVLVPIIKRNGQIIRFGKAIIALPIIAPSDEQPPESVND